MVANKINNKNGSFLQSSRWIVLSMLSGVLCFSLSTFDISYTIQAVKINIPWAMLFPIIAALAYGRRGGLLAALCGAAWFPFYLWPNNGYSNILSALILLVFFSTIGWNRHKDESYKQFWIHLLLNLLLMSLSYYFLFNSLLSINPPFWAENCITELPQQVINIFVIKNVINFSLLAIYAESILRIPPVRKLLNLPHYFCMRLNSFVFLLSLGIAFFIWGAYFLMDWVLIQKGTLVFSKYLVLALHVIFFSVGIITRILMYFIESEQLTKDELQDKMLQFSTIVSNVPSVVYRCEWINKELRLSFASPNIQQITGYPSNYYTGSTARDYFNDIHPEDIDWFKEKLYKHIADKSTGVYEIEYRVIDISGQVHWVIDKGQAHYNKKNELLYLDGIINDISHKKEIEKELQKYQTELESLVQQRTEALQNLNKDLQNKNAIIQEQNKIVKQQSQHKDEFLANMSHEIRTPLNAIIGLIDLIKLDQLDQKTLNYIQTISFSSNHLLQLVNNILDYSKINAQQIELDSNPIELTKIAKQTCLSLAERANNKGLEINCKVKGPIEPFLQGDEIRLNQILINLLGNAIKFTEKGSILLHIKALKQENNKQYIRFTIADTGIGIPKTKQASIFNKFIQADSSITRNYGGTGLGLSIAQQLVKLMGGELQVYSREQQGTLFMFTIGLEISSAPDPKELSPQVTSRNIQVKVLLVDDNKINILVAKAMFRQFEGAKLQVETALNGFEALTLLKDKQYDLIFMDVQMPELNGYEATKKIRQELKVNTPIIALTADASESTKKTCFEAGMNAFLSKPLSKSILFNKLEDYILEFTQ